MATATEQLVETALRDRISKALDTGIILTEVPPDGDVAYFTTAAKVLAGRTPSEATRELVGLLARDRRFIRTLIDPVHCQAVEAVAVARSSGTALEFGLERELADLLEAGQQDGDRLLRLLEMLDVAGAERKCLAFQSQLLATANPLVRSKAAKLVARGYRRASLADKLMMDSDPRVQASVVEALWHQSDDDVTRLMLRAAQSPHPRVAGNAAVGLYHSGYVQSVRLLRRMAAHPDVRFRATAAWAMGECGDPRFLADLNAMRDGSAGVSRLSILRALSRIRRRQQEYSERGPIGIPLHSATIERGGRRRVRFSLLSVQAGEPLRALDLVVSEDGQEVDVSFKAETPPGILLAGFVLPSPDSLLGGLCRQASERWTRLRRASDSWRFEYYGADDAAMLAALQRTAAALGDLAGARHLFLAVEGVQGHPAATALERVFGQLAESNIRMHAFLPPEGTGDLRQALEGHVGCSVVSARPEEIPSRVENTYMALLNSFEVVWSGEGSTTATGRIAICGACGVGAAEFSLTPGRTSRVSV